jgi:RNA polymerase sigma factor (sigma-70 family)
MFDDQPAPNSQDVRHWHAFLQGSEQSFTSLHDTYYNSLYFYGLKIVPDNEQVKNAIQELFLSLWKRRRRLSPVCSVKHYLLCAFRRHLYRLLDKEQQQKRFAANNDSEGFIFSAEDLIVHQETQRFTRALLARSLNQLPARQRELIYLRYTAGLTPAEIADLLQINYQSVLNTLARAIATLRINMTLPAPSEAITT